MSNPPEPWSDEWIDALVLDLIIAADNKCGCYETGCEHDYRRLARAVAAKAMEEAAMIADAERAESKESRSNYARHAQDVVDGQIGASSRIAAAIRARAREAAGGK